MIAPAARSRLIAVSLTLLTAGALRAQTGGSAREGLEFTWTKQVRAGAVLVVRNGDGPIVVRPSTSDRIEVRAVKKVRPRGRPSEVGFDVRESGDQIEVCTLYGQQESCRDRGGNNNVRVSVEYTVFVPRTVRVRMSTGNGDVQIDGAGAEVAASTGNGDIRIGETSGRVDASTGNGDVQIDGANGEVHVSTGNGRVFVLTSHGGVDASTGNGDVDVRIKALPIERDMKFSSGSGSIRVTLPADFNGRIDASSGNGTLRSEFEISVLGRLDAQHIRGTIGRGGPLIRLSTGSGMIEIRKN